MHRGAARCSPRRAWPATSPSGGELRAGAARPASTRARIHLHGNAKSRGRAARGARRGRRPRRASTTSTSSSASSGSSRTGAASASCCASRPGVSPDTHPTISTGGPNTKFGFNLGRRARPRSTRAQRSDRLDLEGLHIHIGSQILDLDAVPPRRSRRSPSSATSAPTTSAAASASPTPRDSRRPSIEDYVDAKVALVHEILGPGKRIARRAGPRAGRELDRDALHGGVGQAQRRRPTSPSTAGCSDNLRPMLYGARYEAEVVGRPAAAAPTLPPRRQALRVRRRDRPRRRPAPTRGPATSSSRPATGAYGYAMANNYNGAPRPPVVFVPRRRGPRRRAARDLRGPGPRPRLIGR